MMKNTELNICRACGIEFDTKEEQLRHVNNQHTIKSPRNTLHSKGNSQ